MSLSTRLQSNEQIDILLFFIKIAILSTNSYCIINPLSLAEDDVAYCIATHVLPWINEGLIRLSSDEPDLDHHFQRKISEYRQVSDEYGLWRAKEVLRMIRNNAIIHHRLHSIGGTINSLLTEEDYYLLNSEDFGSEFSEAAFLKLPEIANRLREHQRSLTWYDFQPLLNGRLAHDDRGLLLMLKTYFKAHKIGSDISVVSSIPFFEKLDLLYQGKRKIDFGLAINNLKQANVLNLIAASPVELIISIRQDSRFRDALPLILKHATSRSIIHNHQVLTKSLLSDARLNVEKSAIQHLPYMINQFFENVLSLDNEPVAEMANLVYPHFRSSDHDRLGIIQAGAVGDRIHCNPMAADNPIARAAVAGKNDTIRSTNIYIVMGDSYSANQVGAMGPNAQATNNTFSQSSQTAENTLELKGLVSELTSLIDYLKTMQSSPETQKAIIEIERAQQAAQNGVQADVLKHLRSAGDFGLNVASKIGVGLAVAAIKQALGL